MFLLYFLFELSIHEGSLLLHNILHLKTRSMQFWLLAVLLGIIFATGGSSRTDEQSLAILRPVSVMFLGIALSTLQAKHFRPYYLPLVGLSGALALTFTHVMPLPIATWTSISGNSSLVAISQLIGNDGIWHQFTLSPFDGWQAFYALLVPLSIILLGIQLSQREKDLLLPFLITLAALSGLLGLIQLSSSPTGPLYFYRIGNNGSATGFFANRNHAATLLSCLIPMLAAFASGRAETRETQRARELLCLAIGVFVVPLILVTGSRSGFVTGAIGLAAAGILYARPKSKNPLKDQPDLIAKIRVLGAGIVLVLGALTVLFSRDAAMVRLFTQSLDEDGRAEFVSVSMGITSNFAPWGAGAGSFVQVYQLSEPSRLLDNSYLNRAHNDWIETALTFGIPGCVLLAIAVVFYLWRMYHLWRPGAETGSRSILSRAAGVGIGLLAIASTVDYPLRTPIMIAVMAVFVIWFFNPSSSNDASESPLS